MNHRIAFVSVIVPCRNEKKFVARCLDSIIANDFPKDRLEVLVVDGMSEDRTPRIIDRYVMNYSFIKRLDNRHKTTPFAINIGIQNSRGNVIMIMGSHSTYQKDYISKCVQGLYKYKADNVGGIIKTLPGDNTPAAKAIALALCHPFGVGNSSFRLGTEIPQWVDTVFGGCYRKEIFEKTGLFNENLVRSQDMDMNIRVKASGGRILLIPSIVSNYYAKSTIRAFLTHNFKDGVWAIYPLKFGSKLFKLRHLLPLAFVVSILFSLCLSFLVSPFQFVFLGLVSFYLFANLYFSLTKTLQERKLRYLFILPVVFGSRHFGYGVGSMWGVFKLLF